MIEARLEGMKPIAVTNHANTHEQAVEGAVEKRFLILKFEESLISEEIILSNGKEAKSKIRFIIPR